MKKKRILFIGSLPPPYHGVNVQNERLLNSNLIHEFKIIHLNTSDHRDLNNLGKIDFLNLLIGAKSLFQYIILLLYKRPHLVYLCISQNAVAFLRDALFILIAKLFSNAKVVAHFRGSNYLVFYENSTYLLKKIIDFIFDKIDYCFVLGSKLKSMVARWFIEEQIFILPNATDFSPTSFKEANLKKNKHINLGYIGYLGTEKGTKELIESFKIIHKQHNNVVLNLAGDFAYQENDFKKWLFDYIKAIGLNNHIIFLGVIKGVAKERFFCTTDIFLFPSWHEGHPNAILEAMASGCPIIATDVGAISESIINGFNGFLIPPKSVNHIVEKVNELINNPQLRRQMGERSRELYEKHFTSEANVEKMISIFNNILNGSY